MGEDISVPKILNNDLSQDLVLAPLLFNLYIANMLNTKARKFGYADGWTLATHHKSFEITEVVLTSDLDMPDKHFHN